MPYFCKLSDPQGYTPCDWDLTDNPTAREAWLEIFDNHTESLIDHARESCSPPTEANIAAYCEKFGAMLKRLQDEPGAYGPLSIYSLCKLRADVMKEFNIGDPYDAVKRQENEAALARLPKVLAAIDSTSDDRIVEILCRGILAGNKFDLGAKDTIDLHANGGIDFFETLDSLPKRPWFVDDLDLISAKLARGNCAYKKAAFFVDNAGGDVILGAIPLSRYLASIGCDVVIAANDEPSLNDITLEELGEVLDVAATSDQVLADHLSSGRITTVGSGCDCPLIDLGDVSEACNTATADCDLLILEGMGRAVESNYQVPFTCDTINLAMIKNRKLSVYMGCQMFDLIARFQPAAG